MSNTERGFQRPGAVRRTGRFLFRFNAVLMALWMAAAPALLSAQEDAGGEAPAASPTVRSVAANDTRIEQVLQVISAQTGVTITPFGKVPGSRITMTARDSELEDVLNQIARPQGWVWFKQEDGSYGLADEQWYKQNILPTKVITKIFRPDHVKASELERAISPMLTSGISSITADDRTNKLIIVDLPEVIERIERLIREIDVQLFTRVFYIRHANVVDVAEKIESYKSDPGTIEVDETTHQIIVTDLLSNIKKMELLIDILDVGPEIVIYDVNNIGLEGEDLEDLQAIIDSIRTAELLFEVNFKQGVFILEDVPEVHDRVEQILEGFDRPVKQVLIQGEILTTSFTRGLSYGVSRAAYSSEPISAAVDPNSGFGGGDGEEGGGGDVGFGFSAPEGLDNFAGLAGNTIGGAVIGSQAYLEWEATFNDSTTRVLLQPRLLVKNQESSRIFVGTEEPFLTTFFNDNTTNNNVSRSTSQSTVTDGLTFEITPSISNSYLVEMEINVDNDDAERVTRTANGSPTDLIRRERQSIETVLTIPSGQTRNIGGLISNSSSNSSDGIPFLSSLPYVGALFGSKGNNESRSNLQLFLTPTVVEDVIPRPTGDDGKRGRLVTTYDKVAGSYDIDFDSVYSEGDEEYGDLLDAEAADTEGEIEALLRDETPRPEQEATAQESSFTPTMTGGSGTAPAPGTVTGGTATGGSTPDRPAPSRPDRDRDRDERDRRQPPTGGTNPGTGEVPRNGRNENETRY